MYEIVFSFKHVQPALANETKIKCKSSKSRWNQAHKIGSFTTLKHFGEKFCAEPLVDTLTKLETAVLPVNDVEDPIVAIFDSNLVERLKTAIDLVLVCLHGDATFKSVPNSLFRHQKCRSNQLFSLIIQYNGRVRSFIN